jgi:hypothetical protein
VVRLSALFCLVLAACDASFIRADTAGQASSGTQVTTADTMPAVYQRVSTQATIARTNWARGNGNWGGGGWGWGPGFYNPWIAPQVFGGTWYQRPYPDHLIYNNVLSGMPPIQSPCGFGEPDVSTPGAYGAEMHGTDVPRSP